MNGSEGKEKGDPVAEAAVDKALGSLSQGNFVVIVDDEGMCNLAIAAEHATAERVAFLIRHSAGVIHACMDRERLETFGLHTTPDAIAPSKTTADASVDFVQGKVAGMSAAGRAGTLKAFCNKANFATAFAKPGHIFVCCVFQRGVLEAPRCIEAAFDLCSLGRLEPVAGLAQLMREDGAMFQLQDAEHFARERNIPLVSVRQLLAVRHSRGDMAIEVGSVGGPVLETQSKMWVDEIGADLALRVYSTSADGGKVEIVAIIKGDMINVEGVPVRIHSECFTGDILGSKRCDCGQQLHNFMKVMNDKTCGVLLYIRGHEGRGIGLANKIRAYKLQDEGLDTVDANVHLGLPVDGRTYHDSLAVIRHLGIKSVCLYTNNPEKIGALKHITKEVVALASIQNERNASYLQTKRRRLNHQTVLETFKLPKPKVSSPSVKIGIVYTTWNHYFVDELRRAAEEGLTDAGVTIAKLSVPGASDLVSGARALVNKSKTKPNAIIVLGVLIKGSSDLYDATCSAVMNGLTQLNASQDVPIVQGLLMCQNEDQAHERSHNKNPAKAWADTALHMANLEAQLGEKVEVAT